MEKSKLLTIAVLGLLLLNLGILAMIWFRPGPPHGPGERPDAFLIRELSLNAEQVAKFQELKEAHHSAMVELQKKDRHLHDEFFQLLKGDTPDRSGAIALSDSMSAIRVQMEMLTFDHFAEVRKLCTPEQQKKFSEIIDDMFRRITRPPGGPPPPR